MDMASNTDDQERINRRVYHAPAVVREYRHRATLNRAEALALLKYQSAFAHKDVLDLGVGTGRTSIYLAPLARHYEAIDYSPAMVDEVRSRMPMVSVRVGDIRDLSDFADASFDFVFGSNCVIDAVSHTHRLMALSEMRRVLRRGAIAMFSSHNRQVRADLRSPAIRWSRNPVNSAMNLARWWLQMSNRARLQAQYQQEEEYALFSDEGHDHACLHYYIDQAHQRSQLARTGFETVEVLDAAGRNLGDDDPAEDSGWLMYVARAADPTAQPR